MQVINFVNSFCNEKIPGVSTSPLAGVSTVTNITATQTTSYVLIRRHSRTLSSLRPSRAPDRVPRLRAHTQGPSLHNMDRRRIHLNPLVRLLSLQPRFVQSRKQHLQIHRRFTKLTGSWVPAK